MTSSFQGNPNLFVPLDYIIPSDVGQKDVVLRQYFNNIASALNYREIGTYPEELTITGKQWIPLFSNVSTQSANYRPVFRMTVDTGALANAGTTSTAHGITFTSNDSATMIYGAATDPAGLNYLPLPFASPTLANNISVTIDSTNVNITTGSNRTAFTRSFVVVEFIRQV